MELGKNCEFCLNLRPIVYCKADAAHLCLSCDAKVHSANALSSRHPRTLVCESCRYRPAFVQCSDHRMFMCHGCNRSQHDPSSQHQRKVISCYMGCPSAKDFAALWGFELNELEDQTYFQDEFIPTTSATIDTGMTTLNRSSSGSGGSSVSEVSSSVIKLPKVGSKREYHKISYASAPDQQDNAGQIWQQILDLRRLQQNQGGASSSYVICQEENDVSSFKHNSKGQLHVNVNQQSQHSTDLDSDLRDLESSYEKPSAEAFPFVLSQMDGDSFWQCKSPLQSGQLWTQNMQDLGVCDEARCNDDFSMPDVDPTFTNIEELFGGEQELARALLNEDATCSSLDKDMSIDKSDNGYERSVEDVSAASSICISHSDTLEKDVESSDNVNHFSVTMNSPSMQPSYSNLSFSFSRLSAEHLDSGQLPEHMRQHLYSNNSIDLENTSADTKQNGAMQFKEKKKVRRSEKQSRYRKARSDVKSGINL
ncbi:OLC1v1032200C1 [Oldenlandia corymbosa var. corymbosa]|uniref:OLC1v1032200C1 n=1 Tax=Oldenlandia corymbosa var. corymbosa TaxID=529605 RepID=A0AAV1CL75_OLDCO|nr:OLC1v1032200C1 [Oldenlandia corymbosa var. corymbosa]